MEQTTKKLAAAGSSLLLATSCGSMLFATGSATPANAAEQSGAAEQVGDSAELRTISATSLTTVSEVRGTFSFSQGVVSSISDIVSNVASASKYLCGNGAQSVENSAVSPDEWTVAIGGDVEHAYSATLTELADEGSAQLTMGCSCAGNPADGRASANAEVFGATMASIIESARPLATANTAVFTSVDGYQVAVPLFYLAQHYSVLAFDLNGEPLANSMGGSNQLWLGSTAASYFAQDVVEITFETRETPPPTPGSAADGVQANVPNVSIVGSAVSS